MAENDWLAVDADGHVMEGDELFTDYLDPAFRDRGLGWAPNQDGARRFFADGIGHPPFPKEISIRKTMTADNRMKVLNQERIAAAVLFPSAALVAPYIGDLALGQAFVRAYNDWIADYVKPYRDRLFAVTPLVLADVDWAVAEAARAVKRGAVAVCVRPNPENGRNLDDPAYDRLYAAIQDLGVPLVVHEATGSPDTVGGDRYGMTPARYAFNHVISHPLEQMFAALSLISGGVLERFPRLRVGFFEAGCSWAPYWIARLDDHFEHRVLGKYMPIKLRPSEYFARQCAVTCDPHDHTLALAVQGIGADKILFATDYPHFDSGGNAVGKFLENPGIAPADQRRILADNAVAFFGLTVPALTPV